MIWWKRKAGNKCEYCPKQKTGPNATCCGRLRETANVREVVEMTMRFRSAKFEYLPGALNRIIRNAPACFYSMEELVDYIEASVKAEEIPINRPLLAGWFDWFEHAHEMV